MTQYRICPLGARKWKVQQLRFGFLWVDCSHMVGMGSYGLHEFDTEAEAENWIMGCLEGDYHLRGYIKEAKRRRSHYVPRRFP